MQVCLFEPGLFHVAQSSWVARKFSSCLIVYRYHVFIVYRHHDFIIHWLMEDSLFHPLALINSVVINMNMQVISVVYRLRVHCVLSSSGIVGSYAFLSSDF